MGGFRSPVEALRARAEALEARLDAQARALREKDEAIARLSRAQSDPGADGPPSDASPSRRARQRAHAVRGGRRAHAGVPGGPRVSGEAGTRRAIGARGAAARQRTVSTVRASIAVAAGAVVLGAAPFAWVLMQPVDGANGWTGGLFASAFLGAVGGIVQLPAVCFGFLATGAEGVTQVGATGDSRTFVHTIPRARGASRWLACWLVVVLVSCAAMPRVP